MGYYVTSFQHIFSFTIPLEETFSHHKPAQIVGKYQLVVNKQENKGAVVVPRPVSDQIYEESV